MSHHDAEPRRLSGSARDGEELLVELFARASATGSAASAVDAMVVALHASSTDARDDDAAVAVIRVP